MDVALGIFGFQEEELRRDQVGNFIGDLRAEKNDAVLQQPRVDVVRPLTPPSLLHNDGDKAHNTSLTFCIPAEILTIFRHIINARLPFHIADASVRHHQVDDAFVHETRAQLLARLGILVQRPHALRGSPRMCR